MLSRLLLFGLFVIFISGAPIDCVKQQSCSACMALPSCGWCGNPNGHGFCLPGNASGSSVITSFPGRSLPECPFKLWFFQTCAARFFISALGQHAGVIGVSAPLDATLRTWQTQFLLVSVDADQTLQRGLVLSAVSFFGTATLKPGVLANATSQPSASSFQDFSASVVVSAAVLFAVGEYTPSGGQPFFCANLDVNCAFHQLSALPVPASYSNAAEPGLSLTLNASSSDGVTLSCSFGKQVSDIFSASCTIANLPAKQPQNSHVLLFAGYTVSVTVSAFNGQLLQPAVSSTLGPVNKAFFDPSTLPGARLVSNNRFNGTSVIPLDAVSFPTTLFKRQVYTATATVTLPNQAPPDPSTDYSVLLSSSSSSSSSSMWWIYVVVVVAAIIIVAVAIVIVWRYRRCLPTSLLTNSDSSDTSYALVSRGEE